MATRDATGGELTTSRPGVGRAVLPLTTEAAADLISRGLAKSGSREPFTEDTGDRSDGGDRDGIR